MDVLLLQSLNTSPSSLPKIDGFQYPPEIGVEGNRAMVATYVASRLQYSPQESPAQTQECRLSSCAITIPPQNRALRATTLINAYYPEGIATQESTKWLTDLPSRPNSLVVCGDFNASHTLWDSVTNRGGELLADSILESELSLLNDGSTTRIGTANQRSSAIDLSLLSADLALGATWETGTDNLQSDHLPIHIQIGSVEPKLTESDHTPKYQYGRADWDRFRQLLTAGCQQSDPSSPDLDQYLANLRGTILKAADEAIPKRPQRAPNSTSRAPAWWNNACNVATAEKRRALRAFQKDKNTANHLALLEATKHCESVAEEAKKKHWEDFVKSEVNEPQDMPKVWKKVKSYRRNCAPAEQGLLVNGKKTETAQEKADVLAATFAKESQTIHLPEDLAQLRRTEESHFHHPSPDNSTPYNAPFSLGELNQAISGIASPDKATGNDPISYTMIRHFPDPMKAALLSYFNTCWEAGSVPQAWRDATVVAIHKEGKPKKLPSSYRPIALTPHLGKLYEKLIKVRLEYFLDKTEALPKCQAGFRRGRSCIEHITHLVEHARSTLTRKRSALATFFDIRRAFDTVWHGKLLHKLSQLGLSGRLYQFVQAFLTNRHIAVKVGPATSTQHPIDMGVPQGSVVAPILFIAMLHDLPAIIQEPGVFLTLFADDLAVWKDIPGKKSSYLKKQMEGYQKTIDLVQDYMRQSGFTLSPEKTQLLCFSRRRTIPKEFQIRIQGTDIQPSPSAKFLGVTLDQRLSWTPHIAATTQKAMRAVNLIKRLTRETWVTPQSLAHLARALVRTRLLYGSEVLTNIPNSHWSKLQRVEMAALKAALGLPPGAINDLVYQEVGWLPLQQQVRLTAACFEARAKATPNCVQNVLETNGPNTFISLAKESLQRRTPVVAQKLQSLSSTTKQLWEEAGIQATEIDAVNNPPHPSWLLEKAVITHQYGEGRKKEDNPHYLAFLAKEQIATRLKHHLQIYTDGSINACGQTGCAFVIPDLGVQKLYKLNPGVSIFTAELYAILMACSYVNDLPNPPLAAAILTDSKSSLDALNRGGSKNRSNIQREILFQSHQIITSGTALELMWLPSHLGIRGNELADKAANQAVTNGTPVNLGLSLSEAKKKLAKAAKVGRETSLRARCHDEGWLHLGPTQLHLPRLPRRSLQILSRVRTRCPKYWWQEAHCSCGEEFTLKHALDGCSELPPPPHLQALRNHHKLGLHQFLQPHGTLGIEPMRALLAHLAHSPHNQWF